MKLTRTKKIKQKKLKAPLTDHQEIIIKNLYDYGPSYALKLSRIKTKMYANDITANFRKKLMIKYPDLLRSERREVPDIEQTMYTSMAVYYWIFDRLLARKLLAECARVKMQNSLRNI